MAVDEGGQRQRAVELTNISAGVCFVRGYPGVRLLARDGTAWDLVRSPLVAPERTLLAPRSHASAALRFLPSPAGDQGTFDAASIVITPPDTTTATTLLWDAGPILDQSGATRPGTYILAFTR